MLWPSIDGDRVLGFLHSVGLHIEVVGYDHPAAFTRGVWIDQGRLVINRLVATWGDVLHEAGHLALVPAMFHSLIEPGSLPGDRLSRAIEAYLESHGLIVDLTGAEDRISRALLQMGDCEATAWSFAAAREIGLPSGVLFAVRPDGTVPFDNREDASVVQSMLESNAYFGIHGLQAGGYCTVREFPRMRRWIAPAC